MPSLGARIDSVRSRHRLAVPAQMLSTEHFVAGGDQKKKGKNNDGYRSETRPTHIELKVKKNVIYL